MSQQDVLKVLEKEKKPLSRSEIAEKLNQSVILVSSNIRELLKNRDIKAIEIDRHQAKEHFQGTKSIKRRMRLYYI